MLVLNKGFQSLQALIPLDRNDIQIFLKRFQWLWIKQVKTLATFFGFRNQSDSLQDGQMFRDRLASYFCARRERRYRMSLPIDQFCDQRQPSGIAKGRKNIRLPFGPQCIRTTSSRQETPRYFAIVLPIHPSAF